MVQAALCRLSGIPAFTVEEIFELLDKVQHLLLGVRMDLTYPRKQSKVLEACIEVSFFL